MDTDTHGREGRVARMVTEEGILLKKPLTNSGLLWGKFLLMLSKHTLNLNLKFFAAKVQHGALGVNISLRINEVQRAGTRQQHVGRYPYSLSFRELELVRQLTPVSHLSCKYEATASSRLA